MPIHRAISVHNQLVQATSDHGSIHAPDHWLRRPCRHGRWCRTLSDVQPRHSWATRDAELPQLRQRSALSVPPMASQSANTEVDTNQVYPIRAPVPSICGKANRHSTTRILGPYVVLDDGRPRKQAARFQDLLQQPSHAYLAGRANARYTRVATGRQSPFVSMATSLSILISDTYGCVILQRLGLAALFGRPRENFQLNHLMPACLVAARFAIRSLYSTVSIRHRQEPLPRGTNAS
jgi:hypothetical protein